MTLVLGIFTVCVALIVGAYWVFVEAPEVREERRLRRRLAEPGAMVRPARLALDKRRSSFAWLDALLTRFDNFVKPLQRMLDRAALPLRPGAVLLACILLALAVYSAVGYLTALPFVAPAFGVLAAPIPLWYIHHRAGRRMAKFEEQFPAAIDLVSRALRAGHALTTALEMVAQESPDPVGSEFRLLFERQNFGMSLEQALRAFADRVPLVDARFFVTAVLTQREVGGNLSEILDNLAGVIRERFGVKREIRVASAHGRITGWVLGALPPVVAGLLLMVSRTQMKLLVEDPLGMQMIAIAVLLQIVGVMFIRKIINVEY